MNVNTKLYHMAEAKDMLPVSRSVSVLLYCCCIAIVFYCIAVLFVLVL